MISFKLYPCLPGILGFSISALLSPVLSAQDSVWQNDFSAAQKRASEQNKDLLILFTASDWCGWCRKLDQEKLHQDAFIKGAREHYQLVKIDFPRRHELTPQQAQQNSTLKQKYRVLTLTSVFLCDSQGRPYARTGYRKGNASAYLKHLKSLQQKKTTRDKLFATASTQQGEQKARTLEQALGTVPRTALAHYEDVIQTIRKSDPDDASGFHARYQVQKTVNELNYLIKPLLKRKEYDQVPAAVENYITTHALKDEPLQTALIYILSAHYATKNYQAAISVADRIIAINEISAPGCYSTMLKKRILSKLGKPSPKR